MLMDEDSRYSMVQYMCQKGETAKKVIGTISDMTSLFSERVCVLRRTDRKKLKWIRSGGGREDIGHSYQPWLKQKGIVHELTMTRLQECTSRVIHLNGTPLGMVHHVAELPEWVEEVVDEGCQYSLFYPQLTSELEHQQELHTY